MLFCEFFECVCGIVLGDNKNYLIDSCLCKLLKENGINFLLELVRKIDWFFVFGFC